MFKKYSFQSHYGLILSHCNFKRTWWWLATKSFNPTMVWFYLKFILSFILVYTLSFNPTMVWFYHKEVRKNDQKNRCFQSHYGLILSVLELSENFVIPKPFNPTMVWFYRNTGHNSWFTYCYTKLSIPLWSDFILAKKFNGFCFSDFQSHYGLILSVWGFIPLKL